MTAHLSTFAIAIVGSGSLIGLQVSPAAESRQLAAILPPWHGGALARAAATGLPIIDMHWNGRVIVLDTSATPAGAALLRGQGFWVLDATGTALCGTLGEGAVDDRVD
jgi:hypothetical protein